jgi:hypothetical protein
VNQVAATKRAGAKRAARWAARAFLVVGGTLAGTAAAWAVSSASAAAETVEIPEFGAAPVEDAPNHESDLTPVTDATFASADDLTSGGSRLVGDTVDAAAHSWQHSELSGAAEVPTLPGGADADGIERRVADKVTAAVDNFTADAALQPAQRVLGAVEHVMRKPEDAPRVIERTLAPERDKVQDFGHKVWDFLNHGQAEGFLPLPIIEDDLAPQLGELIPAEMTAGKKPVASQQERVFTVRSEEEAQNPEQRNGAFSLLTTEHTDVFGGDSDVPAPVLPVRLPMTPPSGPSAPGGVFGGGHLDGSLIGVPAGAPSAFDTIAAGSVRSVLRHVPVGPGEQPGVTPD